MAWINPLSPAPTPAPTAPAKPAAPTPAAPAPAPGFTNASSFTPARSAPVNLGTPAAASPFAAGGGIPARYFQTAGGAPLAVAHALGFDSRTSAALDAPSGQGAVAAPNASTGVDVQTQAAQDAATVQQVYETEGPEAAARKMEELATANQNIPGYVDALIVAAAPTLQKIGVDLGARVTNGDDDDAQDGNLTQDTLTSLANVANLAGEQGQSILGSALAGALPGGDDVNLNQFDDVFRDLGDKGAALGGAVVMALEHRGNQAAADDLAEDVSKSDDGTFKTKATGTSVGASYDKQWGTVQTNGPTDPKKTGGKSGSNVQVGSVGTQADVYDSGLNASASGNVGGVDVEAHASGPSLRMGAKAKGSLGENGLKVSVDVNVDATLAQAGTSGTVTVPVRMPGGEEVDVTIQLSADAKAGAYGTLTVNIELGPDGQPKVDVQGKGFAGIEGSITGTVTVSHDGHTMMSGTVQVSGAAGAGAGFKADVGMEDGKITFDAEGKIVAGAGGGVSFSGSVDVANTTLALRDILLGLARAGFEEGAEIAVDSGEAVWNMGQVAGGAVWDGTQWAGRQVKEGGEWVIDKADDLWDAVT